MPLSEHDRLYISTLAQDTSKGHTARINKIRDAAAGNEDREAEMIEGLAHAYATIYVQKQLAGNTVDYFFGSYQIPEAFRPRVKQHISLIMIAKAAATGGKRHRRTRRHKRRSRKSRK
jgi:hypothetical protein